MPLFVFGVAGEQVLGMGSAFVSLPLKIATSRRSVRREDVSLTPELVLRACSVPACVSVHPIKNGIFLKKLMRASVVPPSREGIRYNAAYTYVVGGGGSLVT